MKIPKAPFVVIQNECNQGRLTHISEPLIITIPKLLLPKEQNWVTQNKLITNFLREFFYLKFSMAMQMNQH